MHVQITCSGYRYSRTELSEIKIYNYIFLPDYNVISKTTVYAYKHYRSKIHCSCRNKYLRQLSQNMSITLSLTNV